MTLALLITAATGAWAQTTVTWTEADLTGSGSDLNTYTKDGVTIKCDTRLSGGKSFNGPVTISTTLGNFTKIEITGQRSAPINSDIFTNDGNTATWTGNASSLNFPDAISYATQFVFTIEPSGPEVTITGTSTEGQQASFDMPQNDVTVTYTLKRDLSVETQVTVGDDHDAQPRYRVQKQGNTFQPVGMDQAQVMALFHVHDQIENQDLAPVQDYTVLIYPVDIEGQPTGDAITFQNFTYAPGQYIVKAQGQGNYVGQTLESNIFTLYQGYEIVVAANEYATYYKDEALYIEDEDAQLYTITAVGKETATATEVTTAAANMPILVKNNSAETKTILLIPTTDQTPDNVEVYSGFKGTLEGTQIAGSTDTQANYVCTGKQFTWVKDAGTIAANRCWLELVSSTGAPVLDIVFDGNATGIETTKFTDDANDAWYDLNGRRLQAKPTTKGVYILNGRKVVVK